MTVLKVRQVGSSLGVILPKELLAKYNLEAGDELYVVEGKDGPRLLTHNPDFEEELEIGRKFMKEYRETFRALAE